MKRVSAASTDDIPQVDVADVATVPDRIDVVLLQSELEGLMFAPSWFQELSWKKKMRRSPVGSTTMQELWPKLQPIKYDVASIASGPAVIKAKQFKENLYEKRSRLLKAADTESAGFIHTVATEKRKYPDVRFLILRGISDDASKEGKAAIEAMAAPPQSPFSNIHGAPVNQAIAAFNATSLLLHFMDGGLFPGTTAAFVNELHRLQDRKTEAEDKFKTAKRHAMEWMEELAVSWGKTEVHNGIALCSQNECLVYRVAEQTPRKTIKLSEEAITEKALDPKLREEILTRASELQGAAGAHPVLEVIKRNKLGAKRAKIDDVTDDMTDTS